MFFKSSDCSELFPGNKSNHFHIKLPEMFHFRHSNHKCALIDFKIPLVTDNTDAILIVTNFVRENFVGNRKLPVLHRCFINTSAEICLDSQHIAVYVDVKDLDTDIIEICVLDNNTFKYINFADGILYCGFHILDK